MDLVGRCHGLIWSNSSVCAWKDTKKATNHIGQVTQSLGLATHNLPNTKEDCQSLDHIIQCHVSGN